MERLVVPVKLAPPIAGVLAVNCTAVDFAGILFAPMSPTIGTAKSVRRREHSIETNTYTKVPAHPSPQLLAAGLSTLFSSLFWSWVGGCASFNPPPFRCDSGSISGITGASRRVCIALQCRVSPICSLAFVLRWWTSFCGRSSWFVVGVSRFLQYTPGIVGRMKYLSRSRR